jgi:hypothetical protein
MNDNTDLPQQPDAYQQQPPRSFKPIIWQVSFITLFIINFIFLGCLLLAVNSTYGGLVFINPLQLS